jgi:hypothetical protein
VAAGRAIRAVLAFVFWAAAVVVGVVSAAGFVGGGADCVRQGTTQGTTRCGDPSELLLMVGVLAAVALGVIGAVLWKPRPKGRTPYRPWQYPD